MPFDASQDAHRRFRSIAKERTRPVVAFLGAGCSADAGSPTWAGLVARLDEELGRLVDAISPLDRARLQRAHDRQRKELNLWRRIDILASNLGQTSFRSAVREALTVNQATPVPEVYKKVWQLRGAGVLTLNLDRLATRAYLEAFPGVLPSEYTGHLIGRLATSWSSTRFIGNLHGRVDDESSWVLRRDDLDGLTADPTYKAFLNVIFTSTTVIFIGISVDDVAVGGHLEVLRRDGVELPEHFWLTDQRDLRTHQLAQDLQVQIIRYSSSGHDHSQVLECLDDVIAYLPREESAILEPIAAHPRIDRPTEPVLPEPDVLRMWEPDKVRWALNERARQILEHSAESTYHEYGQFVEKYDRAIYGAWYVRPGEELLGYRVLREVGRGSFGEVFEAQAPQGDKVALKVLHERVRDDPLMLQGFRRGVRSMAILQARGVAGMVPYLDASEIPAFVVMKWVEGPNLQEAKVAKQIESWHEVIPIAHRICEIIRSAHALPERVLHRDIRPPNIMLEGFYTNRDGAEVVILDFDLSWHMDAYEQSVILTPSMGYMAPEQSIRTPGASTRSAAVDSFGLGMTLFFLCSGRDPFVQEHRQHGWEERVADSVRSLPKTHWRSLPARVGRLIMHATRDRQSERPDVGLITNELSRLSRVLRAPETVDDADLLVEEVAARSAVFSGYVWDEDRLAASVKLTGGALVSMIADDAMANVNLELGWSRIGNEERKKVQKYLGPRATEIRDQLQANGIEVTRYAVEHESMLLAARASTEWVAQNLDRFAELIDSAVPKLRF